MSPFQIVLIVLGALAIAALVAVGLRTKAGQDAAIASGTRLVIVLLAWVEKWLMARLGAPARGLSPDGRVDARLDGVKRARALVQDVRQQLPGGRR